jgi:hypothetical protein
MAEPPARTERCRNASSSAERRGEALWVFGSTRNALRDDGLRGPGREMGRANASRPRIAKPTMIYPGAISGVHIFPQDLGGECALHRLVTGQSSWHERDDDALVRLGILFDVDPPNWLSLPSPAAVWSGPPNPSVRPWISQSARNG